MWFKNKCKFKKRCEDWIVEDGPNIEFNLIYLPTMEYLGRVAEEEVIILRSVSKRKPKVWL